MFIIICDSIWNGHKLVILNWTLYIYYNIRRYFWKLLYVVGIFIYLIKIILHLKISNIVKTTLSETC